MTRNELIEALEKAIADEQRDLLIAAFEVRFPRHYMPGRSGFGPTRWERFKRMLDAEAYESAALTLVPEGWAYGVGNGPNDPWAWVAPNGDKTWVAPEDLCNAPTPALAICLAAIRAGGEG